LTAQSSGVDGSSAAALLERARTTSSTGYQEADPSELQGSAGAGSALEGASTAATEAALAKPSKKAASGAKAAHKVAPARHASSTSLASSAVGAAAPKKHGSVAAAAAEGVDAVSASEGRRLSTSSALDWEPAEASDSVAAKRTAGAGTRAPGSKAAAGSTGVRQRKLTRQSDADGYGAAGVGRVAGGGAAAAASSAVPEDEEHKVPALQFGRHSSSDDARGDTGTDDFTHRSRVRQSWQGLVWVLHQATSS
jgi:hypothetical protein